MARITRVVARRSAIGAAALAVLVVLAPAVCHAGEIAIDVAPSTLNLASNGKVVTVHTDVFYDEVVVYSVYLAGVAIDSWKADAQGYFVAKFLMDDVKGIDGLQIDELNTLRFVALTVDDVAVWGDAEVMVIDRGRRTPQRQRSEID